MEIFNDEWGSYWDDPWDEYSRVKDDLYDEDDSEYCDCWQDVEIANSYEDKVVSQFNPDSCLPSWLFHLVKKLESFWQLFYALFCERFNNYVCNNFTLPPF